MTLRSINTLHPYVFRALYDWLIDSDVTPHLLVNVHTKGVKVPTQFQSQENLILSISPRAVVNFDIKDRGIAFTTRFNGVSEDIYIPYKAMSQLISSEDQIAFPLATWLVFDDSQDDDLEDENTFSLDEDGEFSVVDDSDDVAIFDSKDEDKKDSASSCNPLFGNFNKMQDNKDCKKDNSKDNSKDESKDDDSMFTLV